MKYSNLDKELKPLTLLKLPKNPNLFPIMNQLFKIFTCKPDKNVNVQKITISGYEGAPLKTYIIEPKNANSILPCIVMFHGGGFMLNALWSHYSIAKQYAANMPCRVVFADYRLAPKYKFPTAGEDCYATYKWVIEHAEALKIDRNKIIVTGDSAGGNLATVVTLMAQDRDIPLPHAAMLIYPATDISMSSESSKKYTDAPFWNTKLSEMMWPAYLGTDNPQPREYASPIDAKSFNNFPPTYIEVAEIDSLHDDGIALQKRLLECGVEVELHEIKNACHAYESLNYSKLVKACIEKRIKWLQNVVK